MRDIIPIFSLLLWAAMLTSCEGILSGIYDEPFDKGSSVDVRGDTISGSLYIEANEWDEWFYVDLHAIREAVTAANDGEPMDSSCLHFEPYKVPLTLTEEWDGTSRIYTYLFRVLTGQGLDDNELLQVVETDTQPEAPSWDFAIHRNNNRTNGGAVLETSFSSLDELPISSTTLLNQMVSEGKDTAFVSDTYSDKVVWVDQTMMLQEIIPCQGIMVNEVLSRWMIVELTTPPPIFHHNGHVFLLRMNDGTIAALRCANYISARNVKCCLTIEYLYPY